MGHWHDGMHGLLHVIVFNQFAQVLGHALAHILNTAPFGQPGAEK